MGIDLQTYRCRIGAVGSGVKFGGVQSYFFMTSQKLLLFIVITMLLLIAGIEPNPGPFGIQTIQVLISFKDLVPLLVWMLFIPVCVTQNVTLNNGVSTRNPDINPDGNTRVGSSNSLTTNQIILVIFGALGALSAITTVVGCLLTNWCTLPKNLKVVGGDAENPGRVTVYLTKKQSVEIRVSYEETRCEPDIDWYFQKQRGKGQKRGGYKKLKNTSEKDFYSGRTPLDPKMKYYMDGDGNAAWLNIDELKLDHGGHYKCVVTSKCSPCCKLRCLQKSKKVDLIVEIKPKLPGNTDTDCTWN